ncbi:MAG: alpha/beta hydrolase [Myxococcales bacterium]
MQASDFRLPARDGTPIFVRVFVPDRPARAVLQLSHGMAEHSARYARLAESLTAQGIAVYANDHRGHGHTAPAPSALGYFADSDGWEKVVDDQQVLTEEIKSRHPGLPVVLFGHSMGSYIARGAALRHGDEYRALVLSGTGHDSPTVYKSLRMIIGAENLRLGKRGTSGLISKLTFEAFNKQFENPRTPCDWLSRDPAEVDKYVADPFCGFQCSNQLWHDVMTGLAEICTPSQIARMPKTLPVYVMSGEQDPVNNKLAGIRKLRKAYEDAGMKSVTVRLYQGARHELTNETNRDEVTHDLLDWLNQQLA